MTDMKILPAVFFILFSVVAAIPEYHPVRAFADNDDVYADEDIMLDEEEQYAVVTVSKITGEGTPTINLHDFAEGYSAIKDVTNKRCYIQKSRHTMEGMKDELIEAQTNKGRYRITQRFDCTNQERVPMPFLSRYGKRIASFCEHYDSQFFERKDTRLTKRATKVLSEDALWCFICIGENCPPLI
ncbi:uncharacterized protein LOC128546871 [Mercenaria mercenaria]|uniref:uncharacterized protein LOC128546871 n=1 Tax=Mercenaria mercenaria TaxID=6596 RepID=UPI00234ED4B1|nr:uncharacterized protein LOC128546871 [Mercenaria mercenaria]